MVCEKPYAFRITISSKQYDSHPQWTSAMQLLDNTPTVVVSIPTQWTVL